MDTPYYIASPEVAPAGPSFLTQPWVDDISYSSVPGLESTAKASIPSPLVSGWQNVWDEIKSDSQSAGTWAIEAVKKDYALVKSAAGTVLNDVTSPISTALDNTYWRLIIALVVIGGALYFIGKGGAVKVHAVV